MAKLGDVFECQITGEWGNECSENEIGTKVLRTTNFTPEGIINYDDVVIRSINETKVEKKRLRYGDIILEKSGGTEKTPVGRVVFCDESIEKGIYLCNNFTQAMRVNQDIAIPRYVFYFMWNLHYSGRTDLLQNKTTGIRNLQVKSYLNENCPIPPLDEQRKIAAVLDKVSSLIAKRRQQLDKLDELVKAKFVEMFGDPVSNSLNFPLLSLPQLGEFGRGVSKHRPRNAPELLGGKYPLIQTGEVANSELYISSYENTYSEFGFKQSKMWKSGTLCITIAANIAKTAILAFDACFPDSVVGFVENKKTNNIFIHYWFGFFQQILEAQAPESAQKNINLKILSELEVIVPPIELQNQFATFVEQTEKTKTTISKSLEKLETLKKALMQEYFGV